jgi:hypothetical protein
MFKNTVCVNLTTKTLKYRVDVNRDTLKPIFEQNKRFQLKNRENRFLKSLIFSKNVSKIRNVKKFLKAD